MALIHFVRKEETETDATVHHQGVDQLTPRNHPKQQDRSFVLHLMAWRAVSQDIEKL